MSSPAHISNNSATDGSSRKRPRHFHQGPDSNSEQEEPKSDEIEPPRPSLYRHALESVFAFLSLSELSRVLTVSRSWSDAVVTMRSIDFRLFDRHLLNPARRIPRVCASRLARHIAQLGQAEEESEDFLVLDGTALLLLSLTMRHLCKLYCKLDLVNHGTLIFPSQLQQLTLKMPPGTAAVGINAVLSAVGRLQQLREFHLELFSANSLVSFTALQSLPQLEVLGLLWPESILSDAQVGELRALPNLVGLVMNYGIDTPLLRRLLHAPHSLRWQAFKWLSLDADTALLLPSLPSLTSLNCSLVTDCDYSFFARLPNLQEFDAEFGAGVTERVLVGLQACSQLTALELVIDQSDFTSAHFSALLPHLPKLRRLTLSNAGKQLDSLRFLSRGPVTRTLTSLALLACKHVPSTELIHTHALQSLTHLDVTHSFPMDALSQRLYTPPSVLLPKLVKFTCEHL